MLVSACLICKNQERVITRALDSIAWCNDIAIVDSGSTDQTLHLINNHPANAKIHLTHEPWRGYNLQREYAASLCKSDWVLLLDADEECSPELAKEIQSLNESSLTNTALFQMPRKNYIATRYVRCWSPDYQTRLVHKHRTLWAPQSIPEIRTPKPNFTLATLKSPLLHNRLTPFSPRDFNDGERMEERAEILAQALYQRGKRATLLQLLTRPALTFLKYYILKGAFLDGRFGLTIAYKTTIGATLKYSALYGKELQKENQETPR
jgi:glycosyltransferase involved in cell wall biosynthesis